MRNTLMSALMAALLSGAAAAPAAAKVKVAASIPDLASIAASVGGNDVEVFAIAKSHANPHAVEVLPSYMIQVARARLYLKVGLGLDSWADAIIDGSRARSLEVIDCSRGVEVLGKPEGRADASQGDVHGEGNPHYWLDPAQAVPVAETIAAALKRAEPGAAARIDAGLAAFKAENAERLATWKARMAPLAGTAILTYHDSWPYFARAFDLRIVGQVEPYPGIPPTARHLQALLETVKAEKISVLVHEPYFPDKDARFLQRKAGVRLLRFSPSCDGPRPGDYWKHLDAMVEAFAAGRGG